MSLPTNRMPGDVIKAVDINQIAEAVNVLVENDESGTIDHTELTNRDAADQHPIAAVTGLQDTLNDKAEASHTHSQYVESTDSRLSDARPPTTHRHPWTDLDDVPAIPTSPGDIGAAPAGDYATNPALTAEAQARQAADSALSDAIELRQTAEQVDARVQQVVGTAPAALDTLGEISERLADDADAVAALTSAVADKADAGHNHDGVYVKPADLPDVSDVVREGDPRLTDARTPTAHNHDERYVRTVNKVGPDETGDVTVEAGGEPVAVLAQKVPPVGEVFTSSFFLESAVNHLRSGPTTVMPLVLPMDIEADQVGIYVHSVAPSGVLGTLRLRQFNGVGWDELSVLVESFPLDDSTGEKWFTIPSVSLSAGTLYGLSLYQINSGDWSIRIRSGKMIGPGIIGYNSGFNYYGVGIGMNTGLAQVVPVIQLRRSA